MDGPRHGGGHHGHWHFGHFFIHLLITLVVLAIIWVGYRYFTKRYQIVKKLQSDTTASKQPAVSEEKTP
jgi:hypothetical protein